jgi:hypothetical protein
MISSPVGPSPTLGPSAGPPSARITPTAPRLAFVLGVTVALISAALLAALALIALRRRR